MKVVIDAMGGDNAPLSTVKGSILARDEYNIGIILSGNEATIKETLQNNTKDFSNIEIIHAPDVISNDDEPILALRRKKESSLVKALNAVKNKEADAIVSAGSTGALLGGATLIIGRIKEIERAALGALIPTMDGGIVLLIDAGANVDSKPEFLYDFAIMGDIYFKNVFNIEKPRIAIANIGTEKSKGNKLTADAYELLENSQLPLNFIGNVEARDILFGKTDIIVCDGFAGNMILKSSEGMMMALVKGLKKEIMADTRSKIGGLLIKPAIERFKKLFDYSEHGGAPILGVKATVIKAHGSSDEKAIKNAIRQAITSYDRKVNEIIEDSITRR